MADPLLLLFVDGVGLANSGPDNPLSRGHTPRLVRLLGAPLVSEGVRREAHRLLVPLDATLGVPGLPQSATGQTTLFTGTNAAALLGRHVAAFPGPRLRRVLEEHSMFARAQRRDLRVAFANAFSARYFEAIASRRLRFSATVLAALAAGLRLRGLDDLRAGRAVSWDVVRDRLLLPAGERVGRVEPERAGAQLAGLLAHHDLVLYETFVTDLAGHRRAGFDAEVALRRLDGLLAGLVDAAPRRATIVLASDHGNLESEHHRRHTRNPVPLLVIGHHAARFANLTSLTEVAGRCLDVLSAQPPSLPGGSPGCRRATDT